MAPPRIVFVIGAAFLLFILGVGAGIWWYLFGPTGEVDSAELVPANTLLFASIPNAATLVEGYETSQVKTLLESPNAKPLEDAITNLINQKNIDLLHAFLPNLSGQSFFAVTHFDYDHPQQVGLIAAMKPKAGLGDFGTFLDKFKATWPDMIKQGTTGTGNVEGVDYEWIQGPGAQDKICVAQFHGWIVTTWGEASLQDWIERYENKSTTTSLAHDLDYEKSLARVGDNPMTVLYVNYHALVTILQSQIEKTNPAAGDYLAQKLAALGGGAIGTRFENGEIVDRFSFLFPRPAQIDAGMSTDPCPFETLKFTGPDTRFYWATSINWKQYVKNLKEQSEQSVTVNPTANNAVSLVQNWVHGAGLDTQQNIVDALGSELSVQAEWKADSTYPEVGLFVKLDKPDDFAPTITAIINSARQAYANSAVIKELAEGDQKFAALEFVQSSAFSPTITENGPYLGVFLTENQAVRSFQRDASIGLTHNADFSRQIGDKRDGATQILFFDTPYFLDRAYKTAMPYLSIAEMFNKSLAAMLNGKDLPPDLSWLAPMGTWSCVVTPDEEGFEGYSVSGVGNQGIVLAGAAGGVAGALQGMGLLPKTTTLAGTAYVSGTPAAPPTPPATFAQNPSAPPPMSPSLPTVPVQANIPAPAAPPDVSAGSIIYITSESKILFDQTPVPIDQFSDFLKAKKAANESLKLAVKVDKDASPDVLSTVMDAGATAGFGVLPYAYTSGADSLPPSTNSSSPVNPAPPNVSTSISGQAATGNPIASSTNSVSTPPSPDPTTNSAPITNSTSDGTPPPPGPPQQQ